ncbi:MAG: hypothetical protein ACYCS0_08320 [bacterium]|jgi:t-SNARE complex subunit (syntaxin)
MPEENKSNESEVATTMVVDKTKPVDATNFNDMIPAISNIVQSIVETSSKTQVEIQKVNQETQKKQIEINAGLEHKKLDHRHSNFNKIFWFIVCVIIALLVLSFLLIFMEHKLQLGISVLSYVGSIGLGFIAGLGYGNAKK